MMGGFTSESALVKLKYFGIDAEPVFVPAERLDDLSVPALILWGSQDLLMTRKMQQSLIGTLTKAADLDLVSTARRLGNIRDLLVTVMG